MSEEGRWAPANAGGLIRDLRRPAAAATVRMNADAKEALRDVAWSALRTDTQRNTLSRQSVASVPGVRGVPVEKVILFRVSICFLH